eukprot:jgi/Tetstr1/422327/TSEL_013170.t1
MSWMGNAATGGRRSSATPAAKLGPPGSAAKDRERLSVQALPMYLDTPEGEVAIEDFEHLALERLQVLKGLEDARSKNGREMELKKIADDMVKKHLKGATLEESRRNDIVSHFILRLAYCRTEELRHWFLMQECDLFKFRFCELSASAQVHFMEYHQLPYQPLDKRTFEEVQDLLEVTAYSTFEINLGKEIRAGTESARMFFKVPFQEVPDLVAQRKVLVRKGFAFVPANQLASIVTGLFRAHLSKELALLARKYVQVIGPEEADRLGPIVETLSTRYMGKSYSTAKVEANGEVQAADLPVLVQNNFPLCMSNMYNRLMEERHLRHKGRLQLGLFLKAPRRPTAIVNLNMLAKTALGVGLPLEQAMKFWKAAFSPRTPPDQFDKNYAYNVRYNYGKEGKRSDFTPFPCRKVIMDGNPGVGEHHGCPYKTFDEENLRAALTRMKIAPNHINEAVKKAAGGHYQLACGAVFEGKHGCACDEGIHHPNQYFEESRKLEESNSQGGGSPAAASAAPGTPASAGAAQQTPSSAAMKPPLAAPSPSLTTPNIDAPKRKAHLMTPTPGAPRFG